MNRTKNRRILVQRPMRSENPAQMLLAQDNDVVQTLAPDRSDQPLGKAVLPRRRRCNWLVSDTHGTQSARDDSAVDSISISDPYGQKIKSARKPGSYLLPV